jgi:hypothetical protein
LNTSDSSCVCNAPNFVSKPVNEDTDWLNAARNCLDDLPGNFGFNVARTSLVKVESNHARAQFGAGFCVSYVRDAADFDLYWSHD